MSFWYNEKREINQEVTNYDSHPISLLIFSISKHSGSSLSSLFNRINEMIRGNIHEFIENPDVAR